MHKSILDLKHLKQVRDEKHKNMQSTRHVGHETREAREHVEHVGYEAHEVREHDPLDRAHLFAVRGLIHQEVPECVNEECSTERRS